ncbi:MAG: beta-ketoacyl-ACP synthase II [Acidobacteriota bacterium]|nr:beta-ketoacyl-ACP synthase II [Acidobacteriota bacterium]MDE3107290.1 beta-ketoacyl-ACP synthase II [Acidobacteriota bacterium]MDE3221971.1 beta-ketoacyl-ACP synthase II [Acidobacteriota bacterium]
MRVAVTPSGPVQGYRVAVTGLGALTCAGVGVDALWDALRRPVAPSSARVPDFDASHLGGPKELRRFDPFTLYALMAADEAWRQSGLAGPLVDAGSIVTTGIGGLQTILEQVRVLNDKGPDRVSPFMVPMMMPNAATAAVSMRFGLGGPCETVTTACAAGTHAIGNAARLVATGRCNVVLAGGAEAVMTEIAIAGFRNMTALSSTDLSRPFDVARDGFVMGEGAGVLVLEEWEHAKARGATILAEVVGAASTADAHHITAPDPDGHGAIRCMRLALEDAELDVSDVSHINAHGTSTPLNDLAESVAVRKLFGEHAPPVTSIKGHLGHSLAAAGALEGVASVLTLQHQEIPPTAGTTEVDPEVGLDVVVGAPRAATVDVVLSNSFGFGGHNGSVVFRRAVA